MVIEDDDLKDYKRLTPRVIDWVAVCMGKLITGSARLNFALAMMFGSQLAGNHVFQDKQPLRPSKTPNNNLVLKADAKRRRKLARNKEAL